MNLKNSMLLANMLSQKPKIMYATIKGSLTENDGVFSGFSSSNYLQLQEPFVLNADTVAEFLFKINLSSVGVVNGIMATPNSYGISFIISSNNLLRLYMGNGSSWTLLNRVGQTTVSSNTDYFIKLTINKGNISCVLSTDKINWITQFTDTITITEEYTYNLSYGLGRVPSSQYLRGSIDLPNSYIKLGATKYNLQAVVGYTVVGSPTIVDGVVSGFSSANYLTLPTIEANSYDKIQIHTKVKTGSSISATSLICVSSAYYQGLIIRNSLFFGGYVNLGGSNVATDNTTLSTNTEYDLDFIIDVNNKRLVLNVNGNITTVDNITTSTIRSIAYLIGYGYNGAFNGDIYLKNTTIKVNNKLWFNGQQA